MRRIKLSPVRENESDNYRAHWKRRSQILGSVLHWAHDAGANKVDFDPKNNEPFTYTMPDGGTVSTELGDTPAEHVNSVAQLIHDTIDGHPLIRPMRRLYRNLSETAVEVQIEIPATNVCSGSTWFCRMTRDTATFNQTSTTKPLVNAV
ncbi:MAG: hypothetical protein ACR2N1_07810 [Rubripirellula sp.]